MKRVKHGESGYIAALAGYLPFADNAFDFCFSNSGVSMALLRDYTVFTQAVSESLRVLKPGGELQLSPWQYSNWNQNQKTNSILFRAYLKDNHISYTIADTRKKDVKQISMTKPLE